MQITSEPLEQLAPEWAELHRSIPSATPFTHPAWHQVWLRHFAPSAPRPLFLAVRASGQLVAACALELQPDAVRLLGDHNVCDYQGPLARPGFEEPAAAAILGWLRTNTAARFLDLWGTAEDSPMRGAFETASASAGWSCVEEHEAYCPAAGLPADFESFVAALGKHDRHELRRKLRNLGAAGHVALESATTPDEVDQRFGRFLEFMRASRDDKDEFLTPAMEAFFRDLASTFAGLGLARLSTLTVDSRPVAMLLAFENAATTFLYNSGYDPAFSYLAVGLLSKAEAIRDSIARGKRTFDFLRGEEDYKKRLGGVPREVLTIRLTRV